MEVELLEDGEGLLTVGAVEVLQVVVQHHVLLEVGVPLEVGPTLLADVGPLPRVDAHVHPQAVGAGEGRPTVLVD